MNIAVAQSGGPTAAINSSLVGVYCEAMVSEGIDKVYGFLNGIEGVLQEKYVILNDLLKSDDDVDLLMKTPSTALGSCRVRLPDYATAEEPYERILKTFINYDIGAFFYIGGNDSMDTVDKLSSYIQSKDSGIKVIGIPKTIDNDVVMTDHTPGFGSAAKYIASTISEIACDSKVYALNSVTVVEIMGRDAGWLTASSALLHLTGETAPHLIYLPELPFSVEQMLADVRDLLDNQKSVIIAVSEGVRNADGSYVADTFMSGAVDTFGHKYLAGVGKYLENVIKAEIGCKVRSVELNIMQRCSSHIASKTDLNEARMIGGAGVRAAIAGQTGKMMTFVRMSDIPYQITTSSVDISEIANKVKPVPFEWITDSRNNIRDEALTYFLPLIEGEVTVKMNCGIPMHFDIKNV